MISRFPFGYTFTTVADIKPVSEFDCEADPEPAKEFVLDIFPPRPIKFCIIPLGATSAPISSALLEAVVTDLDDENVSDDSDRVSNLDPSQAAPANDEHF